MTPYHEVSEIVFNTPSANSLELILWKLLISRKGFTRDLFNFLTFMVQREKYLCNFSCNTQSTVLEILVLEIFVQRDLLIINKIECQILYK